MNIKAVRLVTLDTTLIAIHRPFVSVHSRWRIIVLDRPELEQAVCDCYAVVKKEYDRLLEDIPQSEFSNSPVDPSTGNNFKNT